MKTCTKCGQTKPLTEFYRRSDGRHSHRARCITCIRASGQGWHHRRQKLRNSPIAVEREECEWLPVEPFRQWLTRRLAVYDGQIGLLADALGVAERTLSRWLRACSHVQLDNVDRVLITEGTTMLWEVYPHLYEDADDDDLRAAA